MVPLMVKLRVSLLPKVVAGMRQCPRDWQQGKAQPRTIGSGRARAPAGRVQRDDLHRDGEHHGGNSNRHDAGTHPAQCSKAGLRHQISHDVRVNTHRHHDDHDGD